MCKEWQFVNYLVKVNGCQDEFNDVKLPDFFGNVVLGKDFALNVFDFTARHIEELEVGEEVEIKIERIK